MKVLHKFFRKTFNIILNIRLFGVLYFPNYVKEICKKFRTGRRCYQLKDGFCSTRNIPKNGYGRTLYPDGTLVNNFPERKSFQFEN